jgi:4-hydroxy-4-methyl-2-oxoglutarate aldolase
MKTEILDTLKRNRVSTTEVADCLNKTGNLPGVYALNRGHFRVGPVRWVYAHEESNWPVHEQIRDVQTGEIVLIEPFDCGDRAVLGDIVSKFIVLYRQAAAIVVTGYVRDAPHLIKENWPVWCKGVTPVGCFNRKPSADLDPSLVAQRTSLYADAIAVCDDSGVVVIPGDKMNVEFMDKLKWIEDQEDIWYECIDRRKWDTFDTICLKRYEQ